MDSLQEISEENWIDIQKEFLKDWPRGICTYHLLETQRKYKELGCDYGFKVYCPFGKVDSGFVGLNVKHKSYEVVIQCPILDTSVLEEALLTTKVINWKKDVLVPYAPDHIIELVKRIALKLNLEIDWLVPCKKFAIYKDEPLFEEVILPEGITFGPLKDEHIPLIDSKWPHKYEGSDWYLKKLIQALGGFGIFDNNELISWVLIAENGKLTHMYTLENHRKKGYGEMLLRIVSNLILKEGKDVIACCLEENPAYKLYEKNRFHRIYSVAWCNLKPKDTDKSE